jgi:hypothetical protein
LNEPGGQQPGEICLPEITGRYLAVNTKETMLERADLPKMICGRYCYAPREIGIATLVWRLVYIIETTALTDEELYARRQDY